MEYRRFENTVIVRMDRNEDLFAELKKVALKENIKLASISALGTFSHMNVGVYDLDQRKFVGNDFDGMFEIVSLTGTINTMDGTCCPLAASASRILVSPVDSAISIAICSIWDCICIICWSMVPFSDIFRSISSFPSKSIIPTHMSA